MANTIQEQLDATGFAKVLVVVQPAGVAPAGAALGLDRLQRDGRVQAVHSAPPLSLIRPVATKASKKKPTGVTWGLDLLGVPELWARGYTGKGILVGHLDTGVDGKHPALKGAVAHF